MDLVGLLFWVQRPFETIFQSISGRLSERGTKKRVVIADIIWKIFDVT